MRSIQETEEEEHIDTEITLGMKSLLGVFFGLVLICGVFFGLGYSLGRGSSRPTPGPISETTAKPTPKLAPQPAVRSPANEDDSANQAPYTPGPDAREPESATIPTALPPRKPSASVIKPVTTEASADTSPASPKPAPAVASSSAGTPATSAATTPSAGAPAMVQIAAISRQEDADVLVAALKKHGYNAVVRNDPRDNLLHVQLGPFTRDEARAMRAKLMADGYNAILK
jgi:cell division septation protein DedD